MVHLYVYLLNHKFKTIQNQIYMYPDLKNLMKFMTIFNVIMKEKHLVIKIFNSNCSILLKKSLSFFVLMHYCSTF